MPGIVYSTRFIAAHGLTGTATYTIPDAHLAVARCVDVYSHLLVPSELFFEGSDGQAIWFQINDGADTEQYGSWRGRQIFNAGETMAIHVTSDQAWDATVSGYLLSL